VYLMDESVLVFSLQKWRASATIVAPLLRLFGGGAHASAFLALVLLHGRDGNGAR
jgi:hypothetical protein